MVAINLIFFRFGIQQGEDIMMDYYGSIVKDTGEINDELYNYFKNKEHCKMSKDTFQETIDVLRRSGVIKHSYSITGWYTYGGQEAIHNIKLYFKELRNSNIHKLAWMYVMNQTEDYVICEDLQESIGSMINPIFVNCSNWKRIMREGYPIKKLQDNTPCTSLPCKS